MGDQKHPIVQDLLNKIRATSEHNYTQYPPFPAKAVVRKDGQTIQEVVDYAKPHFNITEVTLYTGYKTEQLEVINGPEGAEYTWASGNNKVATVANGLITRKGKGETDVTCSFVGPDGEEMILSCHVVGSADVARVYDKDYSNAADAGAKAVANQACLVPLSSSLSYTLKTPEDVLKVRNIYSGAKITVKPCPNSAEHTYELETETIDDITYYRSKIKGTPIIRCTNTKTGAITYYALGERLTFNVQGTYELLTDVDLTHTIYIDFGVLGGEATFDFCGHTLRATKDTAHSGSQRIAVLEANRASLTIKGNGKILQTEDSGLRALSAWQKPMTILNGEYHGGTVETIYAYNAIITIEDAKVVGIPVEDGHGDPYRFTLNCYDANYASGKANFVIKGGEYFHINPAESYSENPPANFVAEGYQSVYDEVTDFYKVLPINS